MLRERLVELREKKGMKQIQVANALDISRVTYNRYEKGEREPDFDTLLKIAKYFNVSVDYLLGREYSSPVIAALCEKNDEIFEIIKNDFKKSIKQGDFPLTDFSDMSVDDFWEHFESLPKKTQIEAISQVVPQITFGEKNITIQYAFPGESDPTPPIDLEDVLSTADLRFHNIFLTENDKQDIRTMLEIIYKKRNNKKETD